MEPAIMGSQLLSCQLRCKCKCAPSVGKYASFREASVIDIHLARLRTNKTAIRTSHVKNSFSYPHLPAFCISITVSRTSNLRYLFLKRLQRIDCFPIWNPALGIIDKQLVLTAHGSLVYEPMRRSYQPKSWYTRPVSVKAVIEVSVHGKKKRKGQKLLG